MVRISSRAQEGTKLEGPSVTLAKVRAVQVSFIHIYSWHGSCYMPDFSELLLRLGITKSLIIALGIERCWDIEQGSRGYKSQPSHPHVGILLFL